MKKYFKILPHKADLQLKVFAPSKEELFLNSMRAMFETTETKGGEGEVSREIEISTPNLEQLLIDFLSEIIYLSETNNEVYHDIIFEEFSNTYLKGQLKGERILKRGVFVKGVTYHNFQVQKKNKHWEATILFDI
ncbi:MAG: archease [Candidatus Pacebacteria bacterium]|nr:archease [Candidatus Paceibacterota bacterium]